MVLAAHIVALAAVSTIDWTEDLRARFLPDDPAIEGLKAESQLFGTEENVFLLVDWPAAAPSTLPNELRTWTHEISSIAGVARVRSILDVASFTWTSPTRFDLRLAGESGAEVAQLLQHPLARKLYARIDGRGTAIVIDVDTAAVGTLAERRQFVDAIEGWIGTKPSPYRFTLAGALPVEVAANAAAVDDALLIAPLLILGLVAFLFANLRSLAATAALLVVALLNVSATFGTAVLLGWTLSRFSLVGVTIIIAVAILDNIHLAYAYGRALSPSDDPDAAMKEAVAEVMAPCFWTSATTAAGFSTLLLASIPQVRELGAICAVGTLWAFVSTFALLPDLLRPTRPTPSRFAETATLRLTARTGTSIALVLALGAVFAGAFGLPRLSLVADFPRLFPAGHPITVAMENVENDWGGSATVSFLVTPRNDELSYDTPEINRLLDFEQLLARRDLVTSVVSILDLVRMGEATFRTTFGRPPTRQERDEVVSFLRNGSSIADYFSTEGSTARIVARVRMMQPQRFSALARDLEGFRDNLADLFRVELAGWPLLYKNLETRLLTELFASSAVAFGVVGLLLLVALRSARLWLCALLVNVVPLLIVLGGLGLCGSGLSTGILMAPGIALGLVVDDTIHYLTAVRRALNAQPANAADREAALASALQTSGPALLITSLTLILGFSLLMLSQFAGNKALGAVLTAIAAIAWLADVTLLPALLQRIDLPKISRR